MSKEWKSLLKMVCGMFEMLPLLNGLLQGNASVDTLLLFQVFLNAVDMYNACKAIAQRVYAPRATDEEAEILVRSPKEKPEDKQSR